MEFKLNEYHRDISTEELLSDLIRVSKMLKNHIFQEMNMKQMANILQHHFYADSVHGLTHYLLPD